MRLKSEKHQLETPPETEVRFYEKFTNMLSGLTFYPEYHGYFKEVSKLGQTTYHIFFNFYQKTLRKKILSNDFQKIKQYFYQLIETLAFLQTHGIAHRDIKPENILLDDKEEKLFLCDFGIAVKTKEMVHEAKFRGTYYSPEWMELCYKNKDPSAIFDFFKTDSFNLGLVTLEMAGICVNFSKNNDFDEYVKDLKGKIGDFKSKFQKEIKENEDHLNFFRDLKDLLKVNPKDRADFLKIFLKRWKKLEDKEKLKYNVLVEDMNKKELIRFSVKKIQIMREIYDSLGDFFTSIESKRIEDQQFTKLVIKRHQLIEDLSLINYPKALLFRGIQFKYGIVVTRNISIARELFVKVLELEENGYCLYFLGTIQPEHEISFKTKKVTRKDLIFLSKMAEEAERFQDLVVLMRELVLKHPDLTVEERDIFFKAHKSLLSRLRTTRRFICSLEENHPNHMNILKEYKRKIDQEIFKASTETISFIVENLSNQTNSESRILFIKMKGDHQRFIAEAATGEMQRVAIAKAENTYLEGQTLANKEVLPKNPIRLGLIMNYSVLLHEIMKDYNKAIDVAKEALSQANNDTSLEEGSYKETKLIIELINDNIKKWGKQNKGHEKQKHEEIKEEETKEQTVRRRSSVKREELTLLTKLAESAYEAVADKMKEAINMGKDLTQEERHLFNVAVEKVVGSLRSAYLVLVAHSESDERHLVLLREYQEKVKIELITFYDDMLKLLEQQILKETVSREGRIFFLKMKGSAYSWISDISPDETKKRNSEKAYLDAMELSGEMKHSGNRKKSCFG